MRAGAQATTGGERAAAYFAGGCFWGVEYYFEREPGVLDVVSGYMGGRVADPSYEQVCAGRTGHAETVQVVYDPTKTDYETLARLFFEIHDPTQVNRQGPDIGDQYRSVVFAADAAQRATAERLIAALRERGHAVATRVEDAGPFYAAEDYHQDYYERTGKTPYCHARVPRF
jgi:peptide methionine sulfoxide reductase msrA/msrB